MHAVVELNHAQRRNCANRSGLELEEQEEEGGRRLAALGGSRAASGNACHFLRTFRLKLKQLKTVLFAFVFPSKCLNFYKA